MKRKMMNIIVSLIIFALYWGYNHYFKPQQTSSANTRTQSQIILTKHGKCRMECRHIDMNEIKEVLSSGKINDRKSEPQKTPCPVFAREGWSQKDNQHIRVVSADCPDKTTIITVIDLENDYKCECY